MYGPPYMSKITFWWLKQHCMWNFEKYFNNAISLLKQNAAPVKLMQKVRVIFLYTCMEFIVVTIKITGPALAAFYSKIFFVSL